MASELVYKAHCQGGVDLCFGGYLGGVVPGRPNYGFGGRCIFLAAEGPPDFLLLLFAFVHGTQ